jgi:hypothetical protein
MYEKVAGCCDVASCCGALPIEGVLRKGTVIIRIKKVILLLEYNDFIDIFTEDSEDLFLRNTRMSYVINLNNNKDILFKSIYKLFIYKLRVLREYLKNNIYKGWIYKSILSIRAPILFILKKE